MDADRGQTTALSLARRVLCDLLHAARTVPLGTIKRRMNVAPLVAARSAAVPKPGWCTLFTKAFGLVAARRPELRRAYVPLPRARLYEHPQSIAAVTVERRLAGEDAVFFLHLRGPENQSLADLDRYIRRARDCPLDEVGIFRRFVKLGRLPRPVRRFVWWWLTAWSGGRKARHLGTFGVSEVSSFGAVSPTLMTPLTTSLNYDVIAPDGGVDVYATYDHRVLDGGPAARALADLEETLNTALVRELREYHPARAAG